MQELTGAIRSLADGKAVGPDGVSVELLRSPSTVISPGAGDCTMSSFVFGGEARYRSSGDIPSSWYPIKRRIGQTTAGASR